VAVRLLRPQLSFQNAGDVPIFSTSDAYSAEAGEANQDLEGVQFPDLPWLVPDGGRLDELHRQVEQSEGGATSSRSRLFAFGYDACQLALAIMAAGRDHSRVVIDGLTGQLSIDAEGYIRREGVWVQLHNGTALLSVPRCHRQRPDMARWCQVARVLALAIARLDFYPWVSHRMGNADARSL